jgi:hypothetical protein
MLQFFLFIASSLILSFMYFSLLFLKYLLASRLILFRLSEFIPLVSCNYCNLVCFLWSLTILYSLIWGFPNLAGQVLVFISPRNRVAQLYPWALGFLFHRLLLLAWLSRRYSNPPPRQSQSQSYITTDSQSSSPSWCQALIWDPRPIFLSPW